MLKQALLAPQGPIEVPASLELEGPLSVNRSHGVSLAEGPTGKRRGGASAPTGMGVAQGRLQMPS